MLVLNACMNLNASYIFCLCSIYLSIFLYLSFSINTLTKQFTFIRSSHASVIRFNCFNSNWIFMTLVKPSLHLSTRLYSKIQSNTKAVPRTIRTSVLYSECIGASISKGASLWRPFLWHLRHFLSSYSVTNILRKGDRYLKQIKGCISILWRRCLL